MPRPRFIPGSDVVFPVKQRSGKQLLATYLAARMGIVQTWAEDLIRNSHVKLDNHIALPEQLINLSDGTHQINVHIPCDWPRHMIPKKMDLDFLYQDEYLAVINKPPGIVVHPARGHLDANTLQNGMRYHYKHLLHLENTTIGSPHRLDKDTSGAIVFALQRDAYIHLVKQFSAAKPHKEYIAVVVGNPDFENLVLDQPIGPHPERKGFGAVIPEHMGGKTSRTDFQVLERQDGWATVKATPQTGRPHQIRIHSASLGLPLAGDRDYNDRPDLLGFPRQALHAQALTFHHPVTGKHIVVQAPLAEDLKKRIDELKQSHALPCEDLPNE